MKKFIDSVKALGEKMTGKEIEGTKLIDIIDETADAYEGGGSGGGSKVVANPELVGDEPDLTGLEVDGNKYKVPQGGGQSYTAGNGIAITDNVNVSKPILSRAGGERSIIKL